MKIQDCILRNTMLAAFVVLAGTMGYAQHGVRATIPSNFTTGTQNVSTERDPIMPPPPLPCREPKKKDSTCPARPPQF